MPGLTIEEARTTKRASGKMMRTNASYEWDVEIDVVAAGTEITFSTKCDPNIPDPDSSDDWKFLLDDNPRIVK
ncbi:hypothetical protein BB934_09540 [Microvirga ossetica]|uniref:Uncharacterized protein n=1 Tax=Microvirga ossetica TaxID=1882682 RepID=A0A1B2EEN2_9HYPH|nr:hypothetical protein [Microvirga ossetica]ANY78441.1 hypothetical protein BB934_09540 [Microvirga ossetica]